jgi:hypothetical protein
MRSEVSVVGDPQAKMAEFMRSGQDRILDRWTGVAASSVAGRLDPDELRRELGEIYELAPRAS